LNSPPPPTCPHTPKAHTWPEALATTLLATTHFILLVAFVAAAAAWLLLGLPEPSATLQQQAAACTQRVPGLAGLTSRIGGLVWGQQAGAAGAVGSLAPADWHEAQLRPGTFEPAAAFTRLRYLSLRRCTLPEHTAGHHGGSSSGAGSGGGLLACWRTLARAAALAQEQAAVAAAGDGGSNRQGGSSSGGSGSRQRACSTGGAALLHWLLPHACGGAQRAGGLLRAASARLGPARLRLSSSRVSGAAATGPAASMATSAVAPPPLPLQALLAACPELRFVDLTCVSGAAAQPAAAAVLAAALGRAGNVHYLAVSQAVRVALEVAAAAAAAEAGDLHNDSIGGDGGGGSEPAAWARDASEPPRLGGAAGSGTDAPAWPWAWLRRSRGGIRGGGEGAEDRERRAQRQRRKAARQAAALGGPLLVEVTGMDDIIASELGL
jgi:hypothetical protein